MTICACSDHQRALNFQKWRYGSSLVIPVSYTKNGEDTA